jgi:hypothetical protein
MFLMKRSLPPLSRQSPQRRSDAKFCREFPDVIVRDTIITTDFQPFFRGFTCLYYFHFQSRLYESSRNFHRRTRISLLFPRSVLLHNLSSINHKPTTHAFINQKKEKLQVYLIPFLIVSLAKAEEENSLVVVRNTK